MKREYDLTKLSLDALNDLLSKIDGQREENISEIKKGFEEWERKCSELTGGLFVVEYRETARSMCEKQLDKANREYDAEKKSLEEEIAKRPKELDYKTDESGFPSDKSELDKLQFVRNLGDSEKTQLFKAPDGTLFVRKQEDEPDRLRNEYEASAFYSAAGVNVPEQRLFDDGKTSIKLTRYIGDSVSLDEWRKKASKEQVEAVEEQLRKEYAIDVLLGNQNIEGEKTDNIIIDKDGKAWRVNHSASMAFGADGVKKKGDQWSKDGFVDELWTMTRNGSRLGLADSKSIPTYFKDTDVLEMANAIMERSKDWQDSKPNPLDALSPENRAAVEKRLAETQQLATRGNHIIKIEDPATFPRETALRTLDYSYDMSKDGLREVTGQLKFPKPRGKDLSGIQVDWLQTNNPQSLGGNMYGTFGDYIADKIGAEEYDVIQQANFAQGWDSYTRNSCYRKLCILKNNGFDCTDTKRFPTFAAFRKEVEDAGYFIGKQYSESGRHDVGLPVLVKAFKEARTEVGRFNKVTTAILKHDAALQLLFENMNIPGFDPKTRTATLVRTEREKVIGWFPLPGDRLKHKTGVCESNSHIQAAAYVGEIATASRVPFHRIHGVWFMARKRRTNVFPDPNVIIKGRLYCDYGLPDETHQYSSVNQNEVSADTHGLPIIKGDDKTKMKTRSENQKAFVMAIAMLEKWEKSHPTETVLEMLK